MSKGPKINKIKIDNIRDSLGIEGVNTTITRSICPIVNTVTPRVFYWPFLTWIYYDFLKNSNYEKKNYENFYQYLRRQDYFFVVASLLAPDSDQKDIVGKDKAKENITSNTTGLYHFDNTYFKAKLGGMYYFKPGVSLMGLINEQNYETGEKYTFPRITKTGEKLALAFEKVIKNTRYYKEYRLNDLPVPEDVLIEYGKTINIGLIGFDEVKELMRNVLFEKERNFKLKESANYIKFINKKYKITKLKESICREIFFDYFSERSENKYNYPLELKDIISQWEVVVGRQYFVLGIESFWQYMLNNLNTTKTESMWINDCISNSVFDFDINKNLDSIINDCIYNYEEREKMISQCKKGSNKSIQYSIQLILSIYNRFINRDDFNKETISYLYEGIDRNSISLIEMMQKIDEYREKPISEFLEYIMLNWIIRQHEKSSFNKLIYEGKYGFYIEKFDGKYLKKSDFQFEYQSIKMVQLMKVIKDLDMLEVL